MIVLDEPCQHPTQIYCEVNQRSKGKGHLIKICTKFLESDDCFLDICINLTKITSILHQRILQGSIYNFTIQIVSAINHKFKGQGHITVK